MASFSVESTRFVKYDELTYVDMGIGVRCYPDMGDAYKILIKHGVKPEEARAVLPLCLKSELYMTANLRELRHILKLRTDKAAHPQMRFIARHILQILRDKLPVIVEDIQEAT